MGFSLPDVHLHYSIISSRRERARVSRVLTSSRPLGPPETPTHTSARHQLNGRAGAHVSESVDGPAGNEDEITGLGLISRIVEPYLQAAADDIERLVLAAVDVRRRAPSRRHDGFELEEGVVRLLACGEKVVDIL